MTCTTGQLFPAKAISELARSKGIWFALDGAQAPVNVPFDIAETGVDFYTCSTHKWMMGPKRTGFIYVRQGMVEALRPQTVGGGSSERYDAAKGELVLKPTAERFESGTQNDALFFALGKALDFVRDDRRRRIAGRCRPMAERFYSGLGRDPGRRDPLARGGGLPDAHDRLPDEGRAPPRDHGPAGQGQDPGPAGRRGRARSIRVSFYLNNRDEDVTAILDSLKKLGRAEQ